MRDAPLILFLLILATFLNACQSETTSNRGQANTAAQRQADPGDRPVAYLEGKPVTQMQLYNQIAPAHGGQAMAEIVLNRAVQARLEQQGMTMTPADIEAERIKLLLSMDPDPDTAARLLHAMRTDRGLGEQGFASLLRRNAGLRRLVRDQVRVSDAAIEQAYELKYGKRYQARLIVADKLDTITRVRSDALKGRSFTDMAIKISTDISASQGGLLSPISPADPTYPKAIRDAIRNLKMDHTASRLSTPIAIDSGYALLWLEEITSKPAPPIERVREALRSEVRASMEQLRMRQLARTLIEQADVVILDPSLEKPWRRAREPLASP